MRSRFLAVFALALAACPPVRPCSTNADCQPEGVCVSGLCAVAPAVDGGGSADAGRDGGADAGVDGGTPLDAGADGGAEADAGVDAGSCGVCELGFACDERSHLCVLGVVGLSFVRPDANDLFGGNRPVRLEVHAEVDASVVLPASLTITSTGLGPFSLPAIDATTWALDTFTPPSSGTFPLNVRLGLGDAGFVATTRLVVDATQPMVSLVAEPAAVRSSDGGFSDRDPTVGYATAYKKDELVELRVQSNVPVTVTAADFGMPAGAVTSRASCSACVGICRCFELDLARVPLDAFRGTLDAGVGPLPDALGNLSAPANTSLVVTRWKWRRSLLENTLAADVVFPPALDDQGRVHVGVGYASGASGALWQLLPTGEARVDFNFDEPDFAPICADRILYAQQVTTQQVLRYDTDGGFSRLTVPAYLCPNEHWTGTPALADERLYLLGNTGRLNASVPGSLACDTWSAPGGFQSQNGLVVASALAGTAARVFTSKPQTTSPLVRVDYYPSATTKFQNELSVPVAAGVSSLVMFDQLVITSSMVAQPSPIALSAFSTDLTSAMTARISRDGGATYGQIVVAGTRAQPLVVVGDDGGVLHRFPFVPAGGGDAGAFLPELSPIAGVDPLLTASAVVGADSLLYAVSPVTGRLSVIDLTTGQLTWTQPNAFTPGAVTPALDVARSASLAPQCARRSGLLYVAALADSAMTAVVVDSPGIDRNAPWPTQHHDPGNTRNPDTPLTPWSCP